MRTTLTIDDDLARELKQKANEKGLPFKEIVNRTLLVGLQEMEKPRPRKAYRCKTYSLGYPPRADLDRALEVAAELEDEEIARKLSLRK